MLPLLALLFTAAPGETFRLTWEAPETCPSRDEVLRRLQRLHGSTSLPPISLAAKISHDAGGYRGVLALGDRQQAIELSHGKSCNALVDKIVVYIVQFYPDPEPAPARAPRRFGGYVRAMAELDVGTLRVCPDKTCSEIKPTGGGSIAGGWIRRRLRVELGIPIHTARSIAAPVSDFGRVTTRWLRAGLQVRVCGALERRRIELLLCGEAGAQLLLGVAQSDDTGFSPAVAALPTGSARLGIAVIWWVRPRIGLRFDAAPGVYFHSQDYQVYDYIREEQHRRRPLSEIGFTHAVFGLGLDLRLGKAREGTSYGTRPPQPDGPVAMRGRKNRSEPGR